jgi:hypothetical protein
MVCAVWWAEFNGTWSADPALTYAAQGGTVPATTTMHVFRPGSAAETWAVDQAYSGAGFSAPSSPFTVTRTGQTTTQSNTVSFAGFFSADDNTWDGAYGTNDVTQNTDSSVVLDVSGGTAGSGESNQAVGQSFTTGGSSYPLKAIVIRIGTVGSPTDGTYCEIATSISGAAIATSNDGITYTADHNLKAYEFSNPPVLSASTKYYFRIKRNGARNTSNRYVVYYSSANPYASHGAYTLDNNVWSSESGSNDLRFMAVSLYGWYAAKVPTFDLYQWRNLAGSDQSCAFSYQIRDSAGATGDASRVQATLGGDAGVAFIATMYSQSSAASLSADTATFTLTRNAGGLTAQRKLDAAVRSYALTGNTATFNKGYSIVAATRSFTLTGNAATFQLTRLLLASTRSYTLTPTATGLTAQRKLNSDVRTYSLTGTSTVFSLFRGLLTTTSSYTLTGLAAALVVEGNKILLASTQSFSLSGQSAGFTKTTIIPVTSAQFTLTGTNSGLIHDKKLNVSSASFSYSGIAVGVSRNYLLLTDTGSLVLTGQDIIFSQDRIIMLPTTNFNFTSGIGYFVLELIEISGESVPAAHYEDSLKLEADGYVDLFQIILSDKSSVLYLKINKDTDWQGNTYEGTGIKIDGVGNYADETVSRPKLTMFNPNGVYSYLLDQGLLDGATVARYRVLKYHIDNDLPVYRRQQWKVSRIASVKNPQIVVELRDMLDGQNFTTPGRMFIPPDFPTVSLQ